MFLNTSSLSEGTVWVYLPGKRRKQDVSRIRRDITEVSMDNLEGNNENLGVGNPGMGTEMCYSEEVNAERMLLAWSGRGGGGESETRTW